MSSNHNIILLFIIIMEEPIDPAVVCTHSFTLLLAFAYIKEELTFPFIWVLSPSLILISAQFYKLCKDQPGLQRAKYVITGILLILFSLTLSQAIKNEGGMTGGFDDDKWLVRHRRSFEFLILAGIVYSMLTYMDPDRPTQKSLVKEILLNICSSLSMPLTICSGGACNSIYISTITSILSSFSMPLTLVVPLLNVIGYVLQLVGLVSLYSVNKWKSYPFWIYTAGMISQLILPPWVGIVLMILAVIVNAKTNHFVYGKKIFK